MLLKLYQTYIQLVSQVATAQAKLLLVVRYPK